MADAVIADHPPRDGREWDCQCARCGGELEFSDCHECGGEGYFDEYETDAINYAPGESLAPCHICHGEAGWRVCCNSEDWCEANPRPGREAMKRGTVEWFIVRDYENPGAHGTPGGPDL